jgi:transcriptional regulator with XRE-family HTH domain
LPYEPISPTLTAKIKRSRHLTKRAGRQLRHQRTAVNDWLSGKTKSLKASTLLKAAKALAVSPQWLESGVGVKSTQSENRVGEHTLLTDPIANQLHRIVDAMLPDDQQKLLDYAEMLSLKRLHDQKKMRHTPAAKK